MSARAISGFGLGLRRVFCESLLKTSRRVDFLEIIPENHIGMGGRHSRPVTACLERWPTTVHGLSFSLGGTDPFDPAYVQGVRDLARLCGSEYVSDHLAWSTFGGAHLHDLCPLPFSLEMVEHVARRHREAQERLGLPIALENITYYLRFRQSHLDEAEFLKEVLSATGADLLLDVNNLIVNAKNFGGDPALLIDKLPVERIRQIHIAGHSPRGSMIVDDHRGPVPEEVWTLYRRVISRAGRVIPTLLEWDTDVPPLDVLIDELDRARAEAKAALADKLREPHRAHYASSTITLVEAM